jgi:hypothetical protein
MESQKETSQLQQLQASFDMNEMITRAVKYLLEGLVVAIAAYVLPRQGLSWTEIAIIALTAAATFAILDLFSPSIGNSSRTGVGIAIGSSLTPGIKLM